MKLVSVKRESLAWDKPLPWPLYDASGSVLVKFGVPPASVPQLEEWFSKGVYRDEHEGEQKSRNVEQGFPLDQVKLLIGDVVQLQSLADDTRYYVTLVGYLKGECVIVTAPTVEGRLAMVKEGQAFVVRFFVGKSAYAFSSNVRRVTNLPFPHLHIGYPKEVRSLVVRRSARIKVNIIAAATTEAGRNIACMVRDISTGGALVAARERIGESGDSFRLKLNVPIDNEPHILDLPCHVRSVNDNVQSAGDALTVQHGVSFGQLSKIDNLVLTALQYKNISEEQ